MAKLKQVSLNRQTQLVGSGVTDVISHEGSTQHKLALRSDGSVVVTHSAAKTGFDVIPATAIKKYYFEGDPNEAMLEAVEPAKDHAKSEAAKKAWETRRAAGS